MKPMWRGLSKTLMLLALVVFGLALIAAGLIWSLPVAPSLAAGNPPLAAAAVPVQIGTVVARDMPVTVSGIGTVTAYNTVAVKSRVDGQLIEIRFREGQEVKAGDILAILDPRPLHATLKQLEANKLRDQAQLANAKADLDRFLTLSAKEFASRQSVDTQRAQVAQFEAQLAADDALIDGAHTQLDYATITAPIAGRTGIRGIDVGNMIHAGDSASIVTLTQLQPIAVIFTVPADDHLQDILKGQAQKPLPVTLYARDNQTELAQGQLELVDNQIDSQTGTAKLKAVFTNADRSLWPGQFVNARLLVTTRLGARVIAETAIQQGPNGPYVWVATQDHHVAIRPVRVGPIEGGFAEIDQGLTLGERIVIDGQYKLEPSSLITEAGS